MLRGKGIRAEVTLQQPAVGAEVGDETQSELERPLVGELQCQLSR
jgi:hypothetical protein